jgi:sucrose-6-phosphate hydrolase SacC (GH32 family)
MSSRRPSSRLSDALLTQVAAMALAPGLSAMPQSFPYPVTNYDEPYRAQFHFTSQGGFLNDVNGIWYYNGVYHLTYQNFPYGLGHANKHWGHATSPDMMHWTQQPIALDPDLVPGDCWSGSTVVDTDNTSGLQTGTDPVLVSIYTATSKGTCLAFSNDLGATWQPYEGNPVDVGGPNEETRDPHVFWYAPTHNWVCVLYENGTAFYTSTNLKNWTKVSHIDFGFECPDFFELPVDGDKAKMKWVLQDASGAYLLGQFDGETFTPDSPDIHHMDQCSDFYAAQTFYRGTFPDDRVVQMAWNRSDGHPLPTQPFFSSVTFPAELHLKTFPEGIRLTRQPIAEIERLYEHAHHYSAGTLPKGKNLLAGKTSESCDVEAEFDLTGTTARTITFKLANMTFEYDVAAETLLGAPLLPRNNRIKIRILRDWGEVEIFGNDGEFSYTATRGFTPGDGSLSIAADADVKLVSADFRAVKRIWPGRPGPRQMVIDDADPSMTYTGAWNTDNNSLYYHGTSHFSKTVGGTIETSFTGTEIDWWGLQNTDLGLADVYIDGERVGHGVDCYGTPRSMKRLFTKSGLSNGKHTIKIVITGEKNPASTGVAVVHDFFVVR